LRKIDRADLTNVREKFFAASVELDQGQKRASRAIEVLRKLFRNISWGKKMQYPAIDGIETREY